MQHGRLELVAAVAIIHTKAFERYCYTEDEDLRNIYEDIQSKKIRVGGKLDNFRNDGKVIKNLGGVL